MINRQLEGLSVGRFDFHDHPSMRSVSRLKSITRPLKHLDVASFCYLCRFPNGSRIFLSDSTFFVEYYYEQGLYAWTWSDGRALSSYKDVTTY